MKRLAVWVVLVGCGGDGFVELDNLGTELAIASCSRQFDCCTDGEIMEQYMGITYEGQPITTEDQCVAFSNAVFTSFAVMQYQESIAMGRMEYDGAAAADCVAAITGLSCSGYSAGINQGVAPSCPPFVIAKVPDGGGCTEDHECTSKNCEGEDTPLGGPRTDGMCKPIPGEGQACEEECATGLYCGSTPSSTMDTCLPFEANGGPCNRDSECASDHCDTTLRACADKPETCDGR